jgi:hypothetical protein
MIQLVYIQACPQIGAARRRLAAVLRSAGMPLHWEEWDAADPRTPDALRGWSSPTILINGKEVTGAGRASPHAACRLEGPPSALLIMAALGIGRAAASLDTCTRAQVLPPQPT